MARIPYTPYPTVQPTEGTGAGPISVRTPEIPVTAFGGAVGAALSRLGTVSEQAGNELFQRAEAIQQLHNHTEAEQADAQYMMKAGEMHAKFSALQGQDAVNAYPGYVKDLQDARKSIRDGLSNDMARRLYDGSSLSTMGRTVFNGAGHAATQQKDWAKGTAKAQMDLDAKTVTDDPMNEDLFQEKLRKTTANAKHFAAMEGYEEGGPLEKDLVLNKTSGLWRQRIEGISRKHPYLAGRVLEDQRKNLTEDDYLKLDKTVRADSRAVTSVNVAKQIYAENKDKPDMTLGKMEDAAEALAKKQFPDDPLVAQHAVRELRGLYTQERYNERQTNIDNSEIVNDAILKGAKNVQELRLDPKVAAAMDALPPDKQLSIPARINSYNAARDRDTNEQAEKELFGLSNNNVRGFLETDIPSYPGLNQRQIEKFVKLQKDLKVHAEADPRVGRAKGWMANAFPEQLRALGLSRRTPNNAKKFDHYTGALQTALDVWQDAHQHAPSYTEFLKDIAPQVLREHAEPKWFGLSSHQVPDYEEKIPAAWANQYKASQAKAGEAEPTDEQVRKAYFTEKYEGAFGGRGTQTVEVPAKETAAITDAFTKKYGRPPTLVELRTTYSQYLASRPR
jgi:hypothetical protein